jgi:RNA polymerase sigma factor (sigma-70 family)
VSADDLRLELERLHELSFGWALHCCANRTEDAEDILQDTYLRVLDGRVRFDRRSSTKTWLFGVIRMSAKAHARRRWLRSALLERWLVGEPAPSLVPDLERAAGDAERNAMLRRALARLPRRQQEVLHLVYYQGLTIEESGRVLGISLGSTRTHLDRGKKRLREDVQGGGTT